MNLADTSLGTNSTLLAIGIIVAILILIEIMIQSKMLKLLTKQAEKLEEVKSNKHQAKEKPQNIVNTLTNTGLAKGETKLLGIEDEEIVAVIMAAVSNTVNIPLEALKIRSIKRIDSAL